MAGLGRLGGERGQRELDRRAALHERGDARNVERERGLARGRGHAGQDAPASHEDVEDRARAIAIAGGRRREREERAHELAHAAGHRERARCQHRREHGERITGDRDELGAGAGIGARVLGPREDEEKVQRVEQVAHTRAPFLVGRVGRPCDDHGEDAGDLRAHAGRRATDDRGARGRIERVERERDQRPAVRGEEPQLLADDEGEALADGPGRHALDARREIGGELVVEAEGQVLLGREVAAGEAHRDLGAPGDLGEARGLVALLREERDGGLEHPEPAAARAGLAGRGGRLVVVATHGLVPPLPTKLS